VLIKNAEALEILEKVDTLVLDKTGTLTEGKPRVIAVMPSNGHSEDELLKAAASVERASEHPLASAIISAANAKGISFSAAANFKAVAGGGASGDVVIRDGVAPRRIVLGNSALLNKNDVNSEALASQAEDFRREGATVIFVAAESDLLGFIAIADAVKQSTPATLNELRDEGLRIVMLSGDNKTTAEAVAKTLRITEIHAGVPPDGKSKIIRDLIAQGRKVAMAGDGINDAPALAAADVGIAMGGGTDVAMESAGITLIGGDLRGIVRARRLSRATMRNIRQNLFFAFVYNVLGVPLAAGVMFPVFGLLLNPMIASAAMSFSSVSVIANALRLRKVAL
jgi:Cu+-exporting ATPase